jgi:enoyl-CoA hydratase
MSGAQPATSLEHAPQRVSRLTVQEHDGIPILTINDRQTRNALTNELLAEMASELQRFDREGAPAAVITGGTQIFASGADLRFMLDVEPEVYAASPRGAAWRSLGQLELPLVAAVAGHALGGGCELALMCDLVIAGDSARFGQPEVGLGLIPGAGGTQRWARALGRFLASEVVLSGRVLDAFEARDAGLVAAVVPAERVIEAAVSTARRIARGAPVAVRAARAAVRATERVGLDIGLELERAGLLRALSTEDRREGIAAMLERRAPIFRGR